MASYNNFLATNDPNLRRLAPFLMTLAPRPPMPRPTLRRPGEAIEPPMLPPPSVDIPEETPSAVAPSAMPEPQHPYRLQADEIYQQMQQLNKPQPGFWKTLAGRFVGGLTTPEIGGFITGETPYYRKMGRLGQQAGMLEGQMTREQQMQTALDKEAALRIGMRKDEAQTNLYGAQAERLRRPEPQDQASLDDLIAEAADANDQAEVERLTAIKQGLAREPQQIPGRDVPYSPEVEAQRRRIATAGAAARDAAREPEIDIAARAIIEPKNLTALKDIASLRSDQRLKIFARARQLDPTFDPGLVNQRIRFLQGYEDPKGRAAINRQSINNILQHAGDLSELNRQYSRSVARFGQYSRSVARFVNTPLNALARQGGLGSEAYVNYATTLGVLKDELALYFAGGYAPVEKQHEMWTNILNENATPAQVEAFAKEVVQLGLRRAATFNSMFKKNMGYDDPNMIIPEAATAGEKLGLGAEMRRFGSGGQLGDRAEPATGGTVRMRAPNGQEQDVPAHKVEMFKKKGAVVVKQ